ncbi:MAG: hypothetical protein ACRD1C_04960 [Terriglobales bacterium]
MAGFTALLSLYAALLWVQKPAAPPAQLHAAHARAHSPATSEAMQKAVDAALQSQAFARDKLECTISLHQITLTGVVHQAEHKGLATRAARTQARKGHWSDYTVDNRIQVVLNGH